MYAVIRSGGKQYRVEPGQTVHVENLAGKAGVEVKFDVLAVRPDGKPLLSGTDAAKVRLSGKILGQVRGPKLKVLKFKKTRQYKIQRGHRQNYTAVRIGEIHL